MNGVFSSPAPGATRGCTGSPSADTRARSSDRPRPSRSRGQSARREPQDRAAGEIMAFDAAPCTRGSAATSRSHKDYGDGSRKGTCCGDRRAEMSEELSQSSAGRPGAAEVEQAEKLTAPRWPTSKRGRQGPRSRGESGFASRRRQGAPDSQLEALEASSAVLTGEILDETRLSVEAPGRRREVEAPGSLGGRRHTSRPGRAATRRRTESARQARQKVAEPTSGAMAACSYPSAASLRRAVV